MEENKIVIDISKILNSDVGESMIEKIDYMPESDIDVNVIQPIIGDVKITNIGESVIMEPNINTYIKQTCSKCAKDIKFPILLKYKQIYKINPDIDEFKIINNSIDIWSSIRQEIIINIPMKPLCEKSCKGS